jgi:DNA repair exonuclease SbcCD ATPase subunit
MNEIQLLKILKDSFAEVKVVDKHTYRATKNHRDKPFQVYYIVTDPKIFESGFDLDSYQRDLLVEDYYSEEGPIQWNFYLYFLVDEALTQKKYFESIKQDIEGNRKLARKYVISYAELTKFISPLETYDLEALPDIEKIWSDALPVELREDVFDYTIAMNNVVERYVYKNTNKRSSRNQKKAPTDHFPKIKYIYLDQYREYPLTKEFDFGNVNLIHGPNAVGKTSLLEAIELAVCGKTVRNSKTIENFRFTIRPFNSDKEIIATKQDDSFYRARDFYWYRRNYSKDNHLYDSFARFNYFDADAAVLFSKRIEKEGGLNAALTPVVFGQDTIKLFDRITTINNQFISEKKALERNLQDAKKSLLVDENDLVKKEKTSLESLSQEALLNRLATLQIKGEFRNPDAISYLIDKVSEADISLSAWKSASHLYRIDTIQSFNTRLKQLQAAAKKIAEFADSNSKLSLALTKLEEKLTKISARKSQLDRLDKYYSSGAIVISDLQTQKNEMASKIRVIEEVATRIAGVNRSIVDTIYLSNIESARMNLNSQLEMLGTKKIENDALLDVVKKHISEVSLLFKQIKTYGEKLSISSPNLADCPLCGTDLSPETLASKIHLLPSSLQSKNPEIDSLLLISSQINISRAEAEERLTTLNQMLEIIALIPEKMDSSTIVDIFLKFDEIINEKNKLSTDLNEIENKLTNYYKHGFSKDELDNLISSLSLDLLGELPESLADIISLSNKNYQEVTDNINNIKSQTISICSEIEKLKKENYPLEDVIDNSEISDLIQKLSDLKEEVLLLNEYLIMHETDNISKISVTLEQLKEILTIYITNENDKNSLLELNRKIESKRNQVEKISNHYTRASNATISFSKIIEEQSTSRYLAEFLGKYTKSISDIFYQLHAPREFKEVVLSETGELKLKKNNNTLVGITELSTGQRTALVLSVFFSMNNVLNSVPQLLIFDDPVAYVDDLNILTFLDYLLKIVLNEKKQIFFATANQKVATLFIKKFEFLRTEEDGFKEIFLSRIEQVESAALLA